MQGLLPKKINFKNMIKNKTLFSTLKEYMIITIGLLSYTVGWSVFVIPNELVGGGVTGLSSVIQYCTGFNVSYSYFIINIMLFLIGIKVLGSGFGFKTIYGIVVTTILLKFLPMVIPQTFIDAVAIENGRLLSAIFGGAMAGLGIAFTFTQGGSTGGTDIVALIINKYRAVSPGRVIVLIDLVIIATSLLIPGSDWGLKFATMIYGYVLTGCCSLTVDMVLNGNRQSVQIMVFSKQYAEIADAVCNDLHRGVTVLNAEGWYTHSEGKVVMVVARKNETSYFLKLVKQIDPNAFVSVGNVMGVYGKGFDAIKK